MNASTTVTKPAAPAQSTKQKDRVLRVLDTTAGPDTIDAAGRPISGARVHEQIVDGAVQSFTFRQGQPLEISYPIAIKFLKIPSFKLVGDDGKVVVFQRPPKQPEELEAGETLKLATEETVARYDELSNAALQHRALEMAGGEKFAENPSRAEMINFIIAAKMKRAKENTAAKTELAEPDDDLLDDIEDAA